MKKHFLRWLTLIFGNILLAALLTACSFGATGGSTSTTATPTVGSTPTATPTPSPTPVSLTVFKGNGFSIGYPQGWTEKENNGQVIFSDEANLATFIVAEVPNPGGAVSATAALDRGLASFKNSSKNYKDENVPATTNVGGVTWNQKAGSGDNTTPNGAKAHLKFYILTTNYPEKTSTTKLFILGYAAPSATFDQTNTDAFQPMLQSFKFTA